MSAFDLIFPLVGIAIQVVVLAVNIWVSAKRKRELLAILGDIQVTSDRCQQLSMRARNEIHEIMTTDALRRGSERGTLH